MKKIFEEGTIYNIITYFYWIMMGNLYFWLTNILFIIALYLKSKNGYSDNTLLFICAIPIGPSLTAIFSVMGKITREKDVSITKDFFNAYKSNFFESMFFWILELGFILMLYIDRKILSASFNIPIVEAIFTASIFICITLTFYIFPIISRFSFKKAYVIKLSFYYLVKKAYVGIIGFITIYMLWLIANQILPTILLFSVGILCYVIMSFQKKVLYEVEKRIK